MDHLIQQGSSYIPTKSYQVYSLLIHVRNIHAQASFPFFRHDA